MTKHTIQYGDIFLVNFDPSIGHEYQKQRPAVVIQSQKQLGQSNLITIMPLTSQMHKKHGDDILVRTTQLNRLFADSLIKTHMIASFDRNRFVKKIGCLEKSHLSAIKIYLQRHFDLDS